MSVGSGANPLYHELMGSKGTILLPSVGRARQSTALALAAGFVAFGQIPSLLAAGAQSAQDSSPLVMIEPATGVDTSVDRPKRSGPVAGTPAPSGNPLWSLPLSALPVTRERPIFSPSRRPPPPPVVATPYVPPPSPPPPPKPAEPDHPLLTLLGTLAGDSQGVGIFVNDSDKSTLRLRTGEDHEGWVLRSVRAGEAVFEKGDRTARLALPPIGSAGQTSASAPPFGNTWRDGDGQLVAAPPRRVQAPASPPVAPLRNTWLDGDGQLIAAPPKSPLPPPAVAPPAVTPAL
jgi:general secretion pathway protein N